ncbi:DNA damage-binding protein 2 isoform X2 [Monodelphis domestica]|uniref:DNA damage-binding protein 2 isoform X2 n=1 Tax=Monodelphis domestica TaxID=13616 RepID=UPI0004433618|nr:DNA damage-binding protein 2 isoform X2 [Monodelphis domestica]
MAPKRLAGRGKRSFLPPEPPPAKRRCVWTPGRGCRPPARGLGQRDGASGWNQTGLTGQREYPHSIIWALCQRKLGRAPRASFQQCLQQTFLHSLDSYRLFRTASPFDRRTTCLEWHPAHPSTLAVGSKGGDIILWDYEVLNKTYFIKGVWNLRLHKKKVTHVALNPHCDWLLATASVDQTVKIWDLRQVRGKSCFVHWMPHERAVNAAYFSPDGARLLTTDQHSEIRVYSASHWTSPQLLIPHPHRHFQHLTPIKATWHPCYDLIVVGRYPDPNFAGFTPHEPRTVDLFDGNSGKMVCQLHDPDCSGIISLNKFNPMGDTLASTMGYNILIWSPEEAVRRKQEGLIKAMSEQGLGRDCLAHRCSRRSRPGPTSSRKQQKCLCLQGDARSKCKRKDPGL